jgi:hypothetical protein
MKENAKTTFGKLSKLQKLVLVVLAEPRYGSLKRREFGRILKRGYWGKDSQTASASLSRALQRLQDRGYLVRFGGRWRLSERNPVGLACDSGVAMALLIWAGSKEFYAGLGLAGPLLEALGIKAGDRLGIKVPGFD